MDEGQRYHEYPGSDVYRQRGGLWTGAGFIYSVFESTFKEAVMYLMGLELIIILIIPK